MRRPGGAFRLAAAAAAVLALAVPAGPTPSGAASTYSASAGGETARTLVRLEPPIVQSDLVDPGVLTAQASFTSFGESTAFASDPYPGSLPVTLPGLLAGVISSDPRVPPEVAKLFSLPGYPLIASSSHPNTPEGKVSAGTVALSAESKERSSRGVAVDGANRTEASVVNDPETDTVTSRAVTELGTVDLGPLLSVGGVRSAAQVVQAASGERQRSTEFSVASLVVLGQPLRVTADGIELAGTQLPVGKDGKAAVDSLLAALEEQGVRLRFVEAAETAEGVISASLVVARRFEQDNGTVVTLETTLGRTFAATSNTARPPLPKPDFGDLPADGGLGSFPGGGEGPEAGAGAPPAGLPTAPPGFGPGAGGGGFTPPPDTPIGTGGRGAPAGGGEMSAAPAELQPVRGLAPDRTDAGRFYPVLIASGAVLALAVSLFRKIGVKPTWT